MQAQTPTVVARLIVPSKQQRQTCSKLDICASVNGPLVLVYLPPVPFLLATGRQLSFVSPNGPCCFCIGIVFRVVMSMKSSVFLQSLLQLLNPSDINAISTSPPAIRSLRQTSDRRNRMPVAWSSWNTGQSSTYHCKWTLNWRRLLW